MAVTQRSRTGLFLALWLGAVAVLGGALPVLLAGTGPALCGTPTR